MKKIYFFLATLIFLSVHGLLLAKIEPVTTYFFVFVWWSFIFLVDSLILWRKGSSLISRLKAKFLLLIFCSACFWIFFEALNLRIKDWYYVGLHLLSPTEIIIFGILAFGTVLPGIMEIYELLETFGLGRNLRFPRWQWWGRPKYLWMTVGGAMLIFPLIWDKYFSWMIWVALIFLLGPDIDPNSEKSLFSELKQGKAQTFCLLLLTGLICGFLWEFWNYRAELKWMYALPILGHLKIFEMPAIGYLCFTVFAVECYVSYQWLGCQWHQLKKRVNI